MGDPGEVQPGETVQVSYRKAPSRETAGVLTAVVEEVTPRHGVPTYKLSSQNDGTIQKGDSGGRVCHDGKYVGNLWSTIVSVTTMGDSTGSKQQPTDTSYAAIYPEEWSVQEVSKNTTGEPTDVRLHRQNNTRIGVFNAAYGPHFPHRPHQFHLIRRFEEDDRIRWPSQEMNRLYTRYGMQIIVKRANICPTTGYRYLY